MGLCQCPSSAAEEGQRALVHPHPLLLFLRSHIAEEFLLSQTASLLCWRNPHASFKNYLAFYSQKQHTHTDISQDLWRTSSCSDENDPSQNTTRWYSPEVDVLMEKMFRSHIHQSYVFVRTFHTAICCIGAVTEVLLILHLEPFIYT